MYYGEKYASPVGELTLVAKDGGLAGLWMEGQKYFLGSMKEPITFDVASPALRQAALWLDRYFAGEKPDPLELPLAPEGSRFRQEVWEILCGIPYGALMTYGEIAGILAKRRGKAHMSAQAVGGAVGHNPISIIIPCHRVVGTNGSLTGYAGGLDKKIRLLELENTPMEKLFRPKRGTAL